MESVYGFIILGVLILFAYWRQKRDEEDYGVATSKDRWLTFGWSLVWLTVLIALFSVSPGAYAAVGFGLYIGAKLFGVGEGLRGRWRQIRDGGFLGLIFSLPVCLLLYGNSL